MEKDPQKDQSDLFLLHLSITQYGYIGYLMGKEYHTSARKTIDKTTVNVEKLKSSRYASEAYALLAGLNGFEIGLAKHKAPFLGRKSEKYVEKAINLSSTNPMGWVEKGNIYYHMPGFFGGSYQKAIRYYAKAVGNFSKHSYLPKWLKLNALVWLGKSYEANEQYEQALKTYKKALEVEPGFSWVRDELYPQLKKKL
ncbi:MAG: tetratricopeptide repeat protein [Bacteroidota bacterium]